MSAFKEQLRKDAHCVFLNPEEFAEKMDINGRQVTAQWDDTLLPLAVSGNKHTDPLGLGVISQTAILFVHEDEIDCPLPGEEMYVNGTPYLVSKADSQEGIIRIELERNTA